jgi:hypothetical protein
LKFNKVNSTNDGNARQVAQSANAFEPKPAIPRMAKKQSMKPPEENKGPGDFDNMVNHFKMLPF